MKILRSKDRRRTRAPPEQPPPATTLCTPAPGPWTSQANTCRQGFYKSCPFKRQSSLHAPHWCNSRNAAANGHKITAHLFFWNRHRMAAGEVWGEAGRGDEYFGPIIPYLKRCLQTVVLLFLWNIFKCEGSRPLFVEKTKYKLISRCPPKLVSLPANTRLFSLSSMRLNLDA